MKHLVFDTETTGTPKNYKAAMTDFKNWPHVIQLAWALFDEAGNNIDASVALIKPDGWVMPTGQFWIDNGFNQAKSEAEGIPIVQALDLFINQVKVADVLVAHNMAFDYPVLGCEMLRAKVSAGKVIKKICTMQTSTDYCKLPGPYGYKWPKLEELHRFLFKESFTGAHDAYSDVLACGRCYFELIKRDVIKIIENEQTTSKTDK